MQGKLLGIIFSALILIGDIVFLRNTKVFFLLIGVAVIIGALPFIVRIIISAGKEKEIEQMFLEFSRNLVESVNAGTPISKSIINLSKKDYGVLTYHVEKLANQITIGIPLNDALTIFAQDTKSDVIKRAVVQISEAERAGGNIMKIVESVAESVAEVSKLKKERKSRIYNLIVQGYIIFIVFIAIVLIMEFKIIPLASGITYYEEGLGSFRGEVISEEKLANPFLFLLLTQGFFTGLVIGKLAEGKLKDGVKHSFILVTLSFLILIGARAIF